MGIGRTSGTIIGLAATLGILGALACGGSENGGATGNTNLPPECSNPGPTTVRIRDFSFSPATLTVARGASVTWVHCGANEDAHTATANDQSWTSGFLNTGQKFTHTFAAAGDFGYFCKPHPFMTARIIVQ